MERFKLIHINSQHIDVKNEFVLVDTEMEIKVTKPYQIVAEKLITGEHDLFTIHTLNDISKDYQYVVIATTWKVGDLPLISNSKDELYKMDITQSKALEEKFVEIEMEATQSFDTRSKSFQSLKAQNLLHSIIFPKPKITNNTIKILKLL